ncbi:MAG: winged helix DNA-binding protein [Sphingomonadales bacterium]|nr:winged helix DNA-binding protein [Sphingomonadales bacterium]MDE2568580.1 winged helix DNA-binding protein [Sphingomonadales bacterium]
MGEAAAPFEYAATGLHAANAPAVSVFADRDYLRAEMSEDAADAGLGLARCGGLGDLAQALDSTAGLGELVLVDCPAAEMAELVMLTRMDMRAARTQAQLVVSTSMSSLDDVFACFDQSDAQILVTPNRGERVIALGRALARAGGAARARELSEEARLTLLRLTEQVAQIAERLDRMSPASDRDSEPRDGGAFRFESPAPGFHAAQDDGTERLLRASRPPVPDPRLVRRVIRQRQLRARFLDGDLFADPAWDILLDLTAARVEHVRVSVTSLCIASGVPPTTALRWIGQMTDAGLLQRDEDETDRRRAFIALTDKAADAMARYFAEVGTNPPGGL